MQSRFELRPFTRPSDAADPSTGAASTSAAIAALRASITDDVDAGRAVRYHTPLLDYDRYYRSIYDRMQGTERLLAKVYTMQAKLYDDTNQRKLFVGKVNDGGLALLNEVMVDGSGPEIRAALTVLGAYDIERRHGVLLQSREGQDGARRGARVALLRRERRRDRRGLHEEPREREGCVGRREDRGG